MPGTPPTSPLLAIPRYSNADAADFAADVNAIVDRVETVLGAHAARHEPGGADEILGITDAQVAAANKDGAAGTPSLRTLGTGANQAMPGNASLSRTTRGEKLAYTAVGSVVPGSGASNDLPGAWVSVASGETATVARLFGLLLAGTATVELVRVPWGGTGSVVATMSVTTTPQRATESIALADSDFVYALVTAASSDAAGLSFTAAVERAF